MGRIERYPPDTRFMHEYLMGVGGKVLASSYVVYLWVQQKINMPSYF